MNIKKLEYELNKHGIPKTLYNLSEMGRKDERFCVEFNGSVWEVYYSERGIKTTQKEFSTEAEACEYIYKRLVK